MSLNTAHANKGVLIYSGEIIILYCDHVNMSLGKEVGVSGASGSRSGRLYLTSHRIIFTNNKDKDVLLSFAAPFFALSKVELEQPVFGANYIKGEVKGQPNGGFESRQVNFTLTFKHGGAIEFGQALLKVAAMASRHTAPQYADCPPPYSPPTQPYGPAPPPAYAPPTSGYYGWVPPTDVFPSRPPADSVYAYDAPPPYPGVMGPPPPYAGGAVGFAAPPATHATYTNGMTSAEVKAAEAAQASAPAYCDPHAPHYAYVPPPPYNDAPPSYDAAAAKKSN